MLTTSVIQHHAILMSLHQTAHIIALHPAKLVAVAAFSLGIGFGGQIAGLQRDFHTSTPMQLVMRSPSAPVLQNGTFGPMGIVTSDLVPVASSK